MVSYNILGDELESSGDELVSSDGEQYVLYGRLNMLDGGLVRSGDESYVLDGELQYGGWRASMEWCGAIHTLWRTTI